MLRGVVASMRKTCGSLLVLSLVLSLVGCGNAGAPAPTLPLRQVRFYETGVAYFQRSGRLEAGRRTVLPVPMSHLDDALKSLVVISDNARTRAVTFSSRISPGLARSLAHLPEAETPVTMADLAQSLRGAQVRLETREHTYSCRVVDVVRTPAQKEGTQGFELAFMTDEGALRTVKSVDIRAITPSDPVHAARLRTALGSVTADNASVSQALELLAEGKDVTIGYISEAPLWRASYRLVLGNMGLGRLQGWALVHNASDEAWKDVRVELATGRPDSFVYPLAAPRFRARELETPSETAFTVPQLGNRSADAMWSDGQGGLTSHGTEGERGALGDSIGLGHYGTMGRGSGSATARSGQASTNAAATRDDLSIGNLAAFPVQPAQQGVAVATYPVFDRIDLGAHHSASVPLLSADMKSEQTSYFSGDATEARIGLVIRNDSGYEWPEGPIAAFSENGFSGESMLPRMRAADQRWLFFADDRSLSRTSKFVNRTRVIKRIVRDDKFGTRLREIAEVTNTTTHTFKSQYVAPHNAVIAIIIGSNAAVTGADRLDYRDGTLEMGFQVPPKGESERTVYVRQGEVRRLEVAALTEDLLEEWKKVNFDDDAVARAVNELATRVQARIEVVRRNAECAASIGKVTADATRLREHLAAFKGPAPAALATRLIRTEEDLGTLTAKKEVLEVEETAAINAIKNAFRAFPTAAPSVAH